MRENRTYTLEELAKRTGDEITIRAIRYYISEGLLPPPLGRGKSARYDDDHLNRLRLIRRLRDAHLPLKEIARRLRPLTSKKIAELAEEESPEKTPIDPSPDPENRARSYIESVLGRRPRDLAKTTDIEDDLTLIVAESVLFETEEEPDDSETWRRIVLLPGVEIHLREPVTEPVEKWAERITASLEFQKMKHEARKTRGRDAR